tara:strand:+ start:90 stop:1247 length:1158 start_codon:yes stop_codon:yes gene_type:complete
MPIYKGTNEVTSGNLYKGTTEIENGYKASSSFYVNELTWTFSTPSVMSSTSVTSNNLTTVTGAPGSAVTGQNFKILCNSGYAFQGGASGVSISGLPTGMTASVTASGSAGPGTNEVLVTLGGVYPQTSQNIAITATGGTVTAYYSVTGTSAVGSGIVTPGTPIYQYFNNSFSGGTGMTFGGEAAGSYTKYVWSGATGVSFYYEADMGLYPSSSTPYGTNGSLGTQGWTSGGWGQSGAGSYLYFNHSGITSNVTLSFNTGSVTTAAFSSPTVNTSVSCSNYTSVNSSGVASLASPGMTASPVGTQQDPRTEIKLGYVTTETTTNYPQGYRVSTTGNLAFVNYGNQWYGTINQPGGAWDGSNPYTGGYQFGLFHTDNVTVTGGTTCT